jgi:hypothetical protein
MLKPPAVSSNKWTQQYKQKDISNAPNVLGEAKQNTNRNNNGKELQTLISF